MKQWAVVFLLVVSVLFTCVPWTGAAGNKVVEEKIISLEQQGWEAIKKKD